MVSIQGTQKITDYQQ